MHFKFKRTIKANLVIINIGFQKYRIQLNILKGFSSMNNLNIKFEWTFRRNTIFYVRSLKSIKYFKVSSSLSLKRHEIRIQLFSL